MPSCDDFLQCCKAFLGLLAAFYRCRDLIALGRLSTLQRIDRTASCQQLIIESLVAGLDRIDRCRSRALPARGCRPPGYA